MDALSLHTLQAENQQLQQQLAERDRLIEQLQQTVRELQQRLDSAERAAKRQAAPRVYALQLAQVPDGFEIRS